jgi:MYXO-CTERM domain-containing protein
VGFAVFLGGRASAQPLVLQRAPVPGGDIRDLAFDPASPGLVYAAVVGPGIYKSTDGGITFAEDALPGNVRYEPSEVLVSTALPSVALACVASSNAVFRSANGGAWEPVLVSNDLGCTALAEGTEAGTFFAATYTDETVRLHTSTDGGITWASQVLAWPLPRVAFEEDEKISSIVQLPSGRLVFGFAANPPSFDLASLGNLGFSDDGKALVRVDGPTQAIADVAWNGQELFAFVRDTGDAQLVTSPDGAVWTDRLFAFGSPSYSAHIKLRYEPSRDAFLALGRERLLQSTPGPEYKFDGGKPLYGTHGVTYTRACAADPNDAQLLLTGTSYGGVGVRRGRSDGKNDWAISSGIDAARVDAALHDAGSGYYYAAGFHGTVFFGATGALSLRPIFAGSGPREEAITALAYDLQNSKRLVIAIDRESDFNHAPELMELADATVEPTEIVAPPFGSHPGWKKVADPRPPVADTTVTSLIVDGMTRYVAFAPPASDAAAGQHVYRSTDDGKTYQQLSLSTEGAVWTLVRDPKTPTTLYAGAGGFNALETDTRGLFRSTDSGETWAQLPLTDPDAIIRYIAIDPDEPQHLWAATRGWSVWESLDGGDTFTDVSLPASSVQTLALAFSPTRKQILIARSDGISAHTAGTAGWPQVATPPGITLGLAPDGTGVATDSGLFVTADALGEPDPGMAGGGSGNGGTMSNAGNAGKPSGGNSASGGSNGNADAGGASSAGSEADGNGKAAGKSDGCGCRTAGGGGSQWPSIAALLVLARLARRRRGRLA